MAKVKLPKFKTMDELRAYLTLCVTDIFPQEIRREREAKEEGWEVRENIISITASAYLTILSYIDVEEVKNHA